MLALNFHNLILIISDHHFVKKFHSKKTDNSRARVTLHHPRTLNTICEAKKSFKSILTDLTFGSNSNREDSLG